MIIDVTGVVLIPGNGGKECPGNGEDKVAECCCDECDYLQCCQADHDPKRCATCKDVYCPRAGEGST